MIIGFDASRAFSINRTGTENYAFYLLKALAEIDQRNKYLIFTRGKVANMDWPSNFYFIPINLSRFWTQAGLAYKTWVERMDILFVPAHTLPVFGKIGLSKVVTIHDLGYEYLPQYHQFPQKYYLNWSTAHAVKTADRIIAVSENTKSDLIKKLNVDKKKIKVIYEGVDIAKYRIKYGKEDRDNVFKKYSINGNYILSVGTIQPRKNYERLIESFGEIMFSDQLTISDQEKKLQLIIVGKKGWDWKKIIEKPFHLGIENRVKFLDYLEEKELVILYQNARCLIFPSLYEGFGLPILEAMASGCPVLASKVSSLPEVAGEAALYFDPYNIYSIKDCLIRFFGNNSLSKALIVKGKIKANSFSWKNTARETLQLWESLIKK